MTQRPLSVTQDYPGAALDDPTKAPPSEAQSHEMASIKATPAIKHLLTLRSPNVLPSPPLSQLNKVFNSTYRSAQSKRAETGWLVAAVSTRTPLWTGQLTLSRRPHYSQRTVPPLWGISTGS